MSAFSTQMNKQKARAGVKSNKKTKKIYNCIANERCTTNTTTLRRNTENQSNALGDTIDLINEKTSGVMACSQNFCARSELIMVQTNSAASLIAT